MVKAKLSYKLNQTILCQRLKMCHHCKVDKCTVHVMRFNLVRLNSRLLCLLFFFHLTFILSAFTDCGFLDNPYGTQFVQENDTTYTAQCSDGSQMYGVSYSCDNQTVVEKETCPPLGNYQDIVWRSPWHLPKYKIIVK